MMSLKPTMLASVVFITWFVLGQALFNLTILHTNDIHGRFDETDVIGLGPCTEELRRQDGCFGGIARRATAVNNVRGTTDNVILLDAGDHLQGPLWYHVYRGQLAAKFMNRLSYDAMVLGTHEFDLGIDELAQFIRNVSFPVLSCNIDAREEPNFQEVIACSTVLTVGGERIGIVGFTEEDTANFSRTGDLKFDLHVNEIQGEVDRLINQENINKVVVLGHASFPRILSSATKVRGVDIWVVGRSPIFPFSGESPEPTFQFQPDVDYPVVVSPRDEPERTVLIVQSYSYGKYLGRLEVTFDENGEIIEYGGNPILLDSSVEKDPETEDLLDSYRGPVQALADQVIGYSLVTMDGSFSTCGRSECNIGNTVADAYMDYYLSNDSFPYWGNINFAITNAGGILTSLDRGELTFFDLAYALPFGDFLIVIEMRGEHILEMLEHSVAGLPPGGGSSAFEFLQTTGLRLEYDLSKAPGNRLVNAHTLCTECEIPRFIPIDVDGVYTFVANSYIAAGGDGFSVIVNNLISRTYDGPDDTEVFSRYANKFSPLWTGLDGRLAFTDTRQGCDVPRASSILQFLCQII